MTNIEIKARYPDLEKGRAVARKIATGHPGVDRQTDTYFKVREGRLKLRESSLSGAQLVPYRRPDSSGPKVCNYAVIPVADAELVKSLLAGILGVDAVVEKEREIFLVDNVRVHLDSVKGLGKFLEFEAVFEETGDDAVKAQTARVEGLMRDFGITEADLLTGSYREMVARSGRT